MIIVSGTKMRTFDTSAYGSVWSMWA